MTTLHSIGSARAFALAATWMGATLVGVAGCTSASEDPAMKTSPGAGNRLARETSPYLLQHAHNPVDWYPWGEEAFAAAKSTDKPILVSIGYSSCHWCHVMAHECFEEDSIAALMNDLFVCIKVDREERPDVDEVYMTAVQLMGIGGGWPLNVFLTPDGVPFYGGTYFPPVGNYGRPSWPDVLRQISGAWHDQRERVLEQSESLREALASTSRFEGDGDTPGLDLLERAARDLAGRFDETNGGFGDAPKFPPSQALRMLLRRHRRTGDTEALRMVERTLAGMADGGIHDQLGGGFHRYSVDERWRVPHFEKMLYDNAQLARVYVEAYQVTGTDRWARIARGTLDYVLREMTEPDGGFRSATDADSEGREGTYFVWRVAEVDSLLGVDAPLFRRAYGMRERGDFVDAHHPDDLGMNVLHVAASAAELAREFDRSEADVEATLARSRETLRRHRDTRVYPGLDDKVLTAWNGLMIGAFAYAGRVLAEPRYVEAAVRAAEFVERELRADDGRLLRTWRDGSSHIDAFLEDYAFLAGAELDLWEATFDPRWFRAAADLTRRMNERFEDGEHGGWFHTTGEEASLPTRSKSPWDHSQPSATSEAALVNLRLAALTGDLDARDRVERALAAFSPALRRAPGGTLGWLNVLELLRSPGVEVVVVGPPDAPATVELLRIAQGAYLPGSVLAYRAPAADPEIETEIPLLRDKREVGGRPAGYVCRNFACLAPVTSGGDLAAALAAP